MLKRGLLLLSIGLLSVLSGYAQFNFFTNQDDDSLSTDFYTRSLNYTALAIGNIKTYDVGFSLFIHNQTDRISWYFDCKTNTHSRYVITGTEIEGSGITQKKIPYRSLTCNIGIARAVTRNWFVYAAPGFVAQRSYYTNTVDAAYSYSIPKHGMWYNITCGGMYVSDNRISAQIGMDLYYKTIQIGLGYSL